MTAPAAASPLATRQSSIADRRCSLGLFAAAWAVATLFHVASHQGHEYLLVAAAGWLLLRPASPWRLALLAVVQIYKTWVWSPLVSNHWLFTVIVSVTILAALSLVVLRQRSLRGPSGDVYGLFAPAVRLELLLLYFFVAFHKLNSSFLDPATSCASTFLAAQSPGLLPDTPLTRGLAIAGTIGAEAAIPLLLVFRRTRYAGLLLGVVFHAGLALNPLEGFYNFSAMVFAAFTLFLPDDLLPGVAARWRAVRAAGGLRAAVAPAGAAVLAALAILVTVLRHDLARDPIVAAWVVYAGAALGSLLVFRAEASRAEPAGRMFRVPSRALLLFPLLTVLNGASPYLGLKTETSFAMFSNLRTEGGVTNHLLVPAATQIFGYQDDLVAVTRSTDPFLRRLAGQKLLIPYFEVRRKPFASVSYVRDGVEVAVDRASDDPRFPGRPPVLLRKLLIFRPVAPGIDQPCRH